MGAKIGVVGKVRMGWSFKEIGLGQKTFFFHFPRIYFIDGGFFREMAALECGKVLHGVLFTAFFMTWWSHSLLSQHHCYV